MNTPGYRAWDSFWRIHLHDEFRAEYADCTADSPAGVCTALAVVDDWRNFFHAILRETPDITGDELADAPVPAQLHAVYITITEHMLIHHDLPDMSEAMTPEDENALVPVIDSIIAHFQASMGPILVVLKGGPTIRENRAN